MKIRIILMVAALAVILIGVNTISKAQDAAAKDGKTIFVDSKCINCHSIKAQGLESKRKDDKVPDLSDVGTKVKADFIKKYLKKDETLNDKKHLIMFKGEDADLDILATWLESLKGDQK